MRNELTSNQYDTTLWLGAPAWYVKGKKKTEGETGDPKIAYFRDDDDYDGGRPKDVEEAITNFHLQNTKEYKQCK
jgi:hypothetical protein